MTRFTKADDNVRLNAASVLNLNKKSFMLPSDYKRIENLIHKPAADYKDDEVARLNSYLPSVQEIDKMLKKNKKKKTIFDVDREQKTVDDNPTDEEEGEICPNNPQIKCEDAVMAIPSTPCPLTGNREFFAILFEKDKTAYKLNLKIVSNLLNIHVFKLYSVITIEDLMLSNPAGLFKNAVVAQLDYLPEENCGESEALYKDLLIDKLLHMKRGTEEFFLLNYKNRFLNLREKTNKDSEMVIINIREDFLLLRLDCYYNKFDTNANPLAKQPRPPQFQYSNTMIPKEDFEKLQREKEELETKLKDKEEENKKDRANTKIFYEGILKNKNNEIVKHQDELSKLKTEKDKACRDFSGYETTLKEFHSNKEKLEQEISQVKAEKIKLEIRLNDYMDSNKLELANKDKLIYDLGMKLKEMSARVIQLDIELQQYKNLVPQTFEIDDYIIKEERPENIYESYQYRESIVALEYCKERLLCILCSKNERNLIFKNCRHFVYCFECVRDFVLKRPSLKKKNGQINKVHVECPTCKVVSSDLLEIYIN
jgi:hypothetical protein